MKAKKPVKKEYISSSSEEEDACLYCNALTCESPREGLIQCIQCKLYAHETCARAEELDQHFTCDLCLTFIN